MDGRDLSWQFFKRTKTLRTDLHALSLFIKAGEAGNAPDEGALVNLFWGMWRPRLDDGDLRDNPPPLDSDIEDTLLEELARLERACRVPNEPDSDLTNEGYESACQYIPVGAAFALRRGKRDGLNEDVVETLQEVSRVLQRLDIEVHRDTLSVTNIVEAPIDIVSLFGVKALVDRELAHVKRLDGKHQEAFDIAFDSFVCAEDVWEAVDWDDVDLFRQFLIQVNGEERLALEEETRAAIRRCLPLYEPQQLVDCFEGLKAQGKSDSWRLVAHQCARLAQTLDEDLRETIVLDGNHEATDWYGYWNRARGWAEDHLGPQELRELRKADEEEASERRLKGYFFGESWEVIPEKAQERLVNVDEAWLSRARRRDIGAVLNDLQVAAEVMCNVFIWQPLLDSPGDQRLLPILAKDRELREKGFFPTLSNYAWVCREQGFKAFVRDLGASGDEQRFLHRDLPQALDPLRELRNPAQHDPEKSFARSEVESLVNLYLGIGRAGILRRLAEVGPKLNSKP